MFLTLYCTDYCECTTLLCILSRVLVFLRFHPAIKGNSFIIIIVINIIIRTDKVRSSPQSTQQRRPRRLQQPTAALSGCCSTTCCETHTYIVNWISMSTILCIVKISAYSPATVAATVAAIGCSDIVPRVWRVSLLTCGLPAGKPYQLQSTAVYRYCNISISEAYMHFLFPVIAVLFVVHNVGRLWRLILLLIVGVETHGCNMCVPFVFVTDCVKAKCCRGGTATREHGCQGCQSTPLKGYEGVSRWHF